MTDQNQSDQGPAGTADQVVNAANDPEKLPETIHSIAGGVEHGIDTAAQSMPEGDAKTATETAAAVVGAVSEVAEAAQSARDLGEALEAGDEGRAASAIGNLASGLLGTAGSALSGIGAVVPEEARGAFTTAATVARGAAGAARSVEQVVHAYQTIERAINRHIVFQTGAIGDVHGQLKALSAQGRRTLSDLYEWTIQVEHDEDGGLDDETLDQMLSSAARLGFSEHSMAAGEIYGVLSRIEMQPMTGPRPTHYTLTLAPRLWRLTLTRRSRVYQDKTHLDVVLEVLRQHGLDVGTHVFDHTEETYPTHEYVVQHDETDFAFLSRLLAYEGIHFHIKTLPGVDAIVLGDRNAHFDPVEDHEELVYHPHDFAPEDGEPRVWELHRVRQPRTACVVLRDFNWRTPHQVLRLEEAADDRSGYGFLDDYGAHFRDQAEGTRLARIRAQEQLVQREVYTGKTSIRGMAPGTWFELTEHPNPTLNQRYLVIATDVHMDEGHTYVCTFDAIPFSVTYRPPRTVPWPRIHGLTNAIVDGEQRSPRRRWTRRGATAWSSRSTRPPPQAVAPRAGCAAPSRPRAMATGCTSRCTSGPRSRSPSRTATQTGR